MKKLIERIDALFENDYVRQVVSEVEQYLGDVITPEMSPQEAREECWTLCIDKANDLLYGSREQAIRVARAACEQLGYPQGGKKGPRLDDVTVPVSRLAPRETPMPAPTGVHHGAYVPSVYRVESSLKEERNPYNSLCPICSSPAISSCRCMGPHSVEDLAKGHGYACKNGHRWSGKTTYTPEVKAAAAQPGT